MRRYSVKDGWQDEASWLKIVENRGRPLRPTVTMPGINELHGM
jgi:hypothetical protein